MTYTKETYRVTALTGALNFLLALSKLAVGALSGSSALISDGVDSAGDVISSFIVMIGVRYASKSADESHPYGHERFECISSIVLALIIAGSGLGVGYTALQKIFSQETLVAPGLLALAVALVSIVAKAWMFWFSRKVALRIGSDSLMANALNYRSDVFSSCGVLVGVAGARLGLPILDSIASLVICALILKSALEILLDALSKLLDSAIDGDTLEQMRDLILEQQGVLALDDIKTRQFGSKYFVDIEIACDGDLPLRQAHDIALRVHDAIEQQFPGTKHCLVHVNPFGEEH